MMVVLLSFVVAWGSDMNITEIEVRGAARTDTALILEASGLSPGQEVTLEKVQSAIRRLYALGLFKDVRIWADEDSGGVSLTVEVEENPVLTEISFEGNKALKERELRDALHFTEGQVVSSKVIHDGRRSIKELYEDKGYLSAEVRAVVTPAGKGRVRLTYLIDEGKKVRVKRINFIGNQAFEDGKLKKLMKTKEARWWRKGEFKEEVYRTDLDKVLQFYRNHGYRDVQVVKDSIYYDSSKRNLFVDIYLKEGPRYRFGKVTWEGNEALTDEQLKALLDLKEGEVYDEGKYDRIYQSLLSAYQEKGYISASVDRRESIRGDTLDVHFVIQEGRPSRVHRIMIAGNRKTKDKVILRELVLVPGQVFRRSDLERSIRNLYMLNYFSSVTPEPKFLEDGDVDLLIRVKEKPTGQASVGLGYSEQYKLIGTVGLMIPNLFGNGQQLDLTCDLGRRREVLRFDFTEPWLLDTPTSLSLEVYHIHDKSYTDFHERRTGLSLRLGRRLSWLDEYSRLYGRYRLEEVDYPYIAPDSVYTDPYGLRKRSWPERASSAGITFLRDSRDLPEFPTKGSILSLSGEWAGGLLGGEEAYQKYKLDWEVFVPTFWKFVLVLRGRAGLVDELGGKGYIPFGERFMPGGVSWDGMIRGYEDRSVVPYEDGKPMGGRTALILNLEYQFPIVEGQLYGLLFADAGNSWRDWKDAHPLKLKRSIGLGVRLVMPPMGTVGFDFGYRLDEVRDDRGKVLQPKGKWNTHFQLGRQFF
ncbi:MAG: outer membrane protein assembly factor BamA [Candidatus Latescibacterota bacterium]|nr:MAG: outer membrane protein assembly factor BamA [Candidatus Latescibacterota bacterium]